MKDTWIDINCFETVTRFIVYSKTHKVEKVEKISSYNHNVNVTESRNNNTTYINSNTSTSIVTNVYYGENGCITVYGDAKIREGYNVHEISIATEESRWILYQNIPEAALCVTNHDLQKYIVESMYNITKKKFWSMAYEACTYAGGLWFFMVLLQGIVSIFIKYKLSLFFLISLIGIPWGLVYSIRNSLKLNRRYKTFVETNKIAFAKLENEYQALKGNCYIEES